MALISNKRISLFFQVIVATIIQLVLTLLFVPVIEIIYEVNIIWDIVKLFGLSNYPQINSFIIPFMLLLSFIQTFISYIFIIIFSSKLQITIIYKDSKKYFYGGFATFFGILCFIFAFFKIVEWLNFTLLLLTIYFFVLSLLDFKYKKPVEIIALSLSVILSIVFYVVLYNFIPSPNHICVLSIGAVFYGIYYSINRGIFER